MDIKSLIITVTQLQPICSVHLFDLELAFGYIGTESASRPLQEIKVKLDQWCEENRLRYAYKPATKEYVFASLDWKAKK